MKVNNRTLRNAVDSAVAGLEQRGIVTRARYANVLDTVVANNPVLRQSFWVYSGNSDEMREWLRNRF